MKLSDRILEVAKMPDYEDVSRDALVGKLLAYEGSAQFTAFRSITKRDDLNKYDAYFVEVEGRKKKNPNAVLNPYMDNGIYNFAQKVDIVTGFDYVSSVERRMKKAGIETAFEKGESWHYAISRALSVHKGDMIFNEDGDYELTDNPRFYFRYQYLESSNQLLEHYHKNDAVAYQMFQSFLKKTEPYSNQKKQGLSDDDTLNIQVMGIKNILTLHLDGHRYRLPENVDAFFKEHNEQEEAAYAE